MTRLLLKLTRPRLSLMNGVTAGAGCLLYPAEAKGVPLAVAVIGVTLLAAGGSAFNQVMERDLDRLMARTRSRPLPQGHLSPRAASATGTLLILGGCLTLRAGGSYLPVLLGLSAILWYLGVYTPLKRRTPFALPAGAVCGALPPLIGWCLAGGSPDDFRIILLAGVLYFWQIPHFCRIQQRLAEEYLAAGIPLVSTIMKRRKIMKTALLSLAALLLFPLSTHSAHLPVSPNGITLFQDYRAWEVIAPSYREDKQHIRVILGNPVAVKALRNKTLPVPDGAVLAKVAWTTKKHPKFQVATVPDTFAQVEFMVKDAAKYKSTGGWGYARFVGSEYKPYGKDAGFVQECFGCHTPVKDNDYLFTGYAAVP